MDKAKSGFIPALENFWNSWAALRDDVKLIVCGSATSWMISNLINSKGGLHGRLTHRILVEPFNLYDCERSPISDSDIPGSRLPNAIW